jgi:hypothetical protein
MVFVAAAVEPAMKIQEVIMRALSGAISWLQAADILGVDPRSVRRTRPLPVISRGFRVARAKRGLVAAP